MVGIIAGLALSLYINYHSYLRDFNLVPGDRGDTRLVVFTLEHWFNVFRGHEPFFSLHMFYPDSNALGFADGLFLFGLPYSIFRILGLEQFTSYQLVLAFMTAIGFVGWFMVLERALHLRTGMALLGGILLSGLNSLQFQADIGKLTAIHLFPLLIWLLIVFMRSDETHSTRRALALSCFGGGLALLFFTSYYPAWFFLFTGCLYGAVAFAVAMIASGSKPAIRQVGTFLASHKWSLLLALVVSGVALLPFLRTYDPLVRSGANRSFSLVLGFAPRVTDVINVGGNNRVWASALRDLGFDFGNREQQMGSPIAVLILASISGLVLLGRLRAAGWRQLPQREQTIVLLSITAVALLVVSAHVGGFSLWYPIYLLVPGASALRALGRILMMVDMIIIVVAAWGMDQLLGRLRSARRIPAVAGAGLLGLVLIAEQVNDTPFRLDKSEQIALMQRFTAPSESCSAFFVTNAGSEDLPYGYYQLDAMMVSMQLGIPTVNGYSGFEPHEAFTLAPTGAEYEYRILDWLKTQGATTGICELDLQTGEFRERNVAADYEPARQRYLASILDVFAKLYTGAVRFLNDGNDLEDLYPENLETRGYVDPGLGHEVGIRYKWIQHRYWVGEQPCKDRTGCFGIRVVGRYEEISAILTEYGDQALRVTFPDAQEWRPGTSFPPSQWGELLMVFDVSGVVH